MPKVPFTHANAREMALRSVEARKAAKQAEANQEETDSLPATALSEDYQSAILTRTREQIDELDSQLAECDDPKSWDALTRARERNFRIWAHLAGLPGPGQFKPSQAKTRPTWQPTIAPMPAPSTPPVVQQAQPSVVPGTDHKV